MIVLIFVFVSFVFCNDFGLWGMKILFKVILFFFGVGFFGFGLWVILVLFDCFLFVVFFCGNLFVLIVIVCMIVFFVRFLILGFEFIVLMEVFCLIWWIFVSNFESCWLFVFRLGEELFIVLMFVWNGGVVGFRCLWSIFRVVGDCVSEWRDFFKSWSEGVS